MTDQELDAALLRLRAAAFDRLARQTGHIANEDPIVDMQPASTGADSLGGVEREKQVRSRWKSFVRWFRGE